MPTASPLPTEPRYYKFLDANQTGRHSQKRLPIGEWIVIDGPLEMCRNGIHVTTIENARQWIDERAHLVEIRGEHIVGDDKLCCREVFIHPALPAWDRAAMVRWAADCAEHALHIYEAKYRGDDRPRKAIEAARSGDAKRARDAANAAANAAYAAYAAAAYAADAAANASAANAAAAYAYAAAAYAAAANAAANAAYAAYAANAAYAAAAYAANAANAANAAAAYAYAAAAYAADAAANASAAYERRWQSERLSALLHGGAE